MKKNVYLIITLLLTSIIFSPISTKAKELVCTYNYNNTELKYTINNNSLVTPFNNGDSVNNSKWYHSTNFNSEFINSSKNYKNKQVCPSIGIEEKDNNIYLYTNTTKLDCSGKCSTIFSTTNNLKVVDTKVVNAVGVYNSSDYFIPTYRLLSDSSIEWSIDNSKFYSIDKSIKLNGSTIKLDKSISNIFTNNSSSVTIYRCVSGKSNKYTYTLTSDGAKCKDIEMSSADKQMLVSTGYNNLSNSNVSDTNATRLANTTGTTNKSCKDTILGDPVNDEDSVAWLLQQLLNYLRILGPMIVLVMTSIDFARAIISSDDEIMQKTYKKLINRLILVAVLFFIPTLVELLLNIFGLMGEPICIK